MADQGRENRATTDATMLARIWGWADQAVEHIDASAIARAATARIPLHRSIALRVAGTGVNAPAISGPALRAILLLVLLASLAAGAVLVGSQHRSIPAVVGPASNGIIAFVRGGDIYTVDPASGSIELIVPGPQIDTDPIFSRDGTHIAFRRLHTPAEPTNWDLIVVRADGSDARVIIRDLSGLNFAWTPDSRGLVADTWIPSSHVGLVLLDTIGSQEPAWLTPPMPVYGPSPYAFAHGGGVAWFMRPPSGDRLLAAPDAYTGLSVMDRDGTDVIDLVDVTGLRGGYQSLPAWSPSGSRIAVTEARWAGDKEARLYVMDPDGSDLRMLGHATELGGEGQWSPDGSKIAVNQSRSIEPGTRDWCPVKWWVDSCPGDAWITIIDVETGDERDLEATFSPEWDGVGQEPARGGWSWSPDGRSILMLRELGGRPEIIDMESDTSTRLPWESDSTPSWQRIAAKP